MARNIIEGAKTVKIYGEQIKVRATIHTIGGFSAHADQTELLSWHKKTGNPGKTYLVHGQQDSMQAFARKLKGTKVIMPRLGESFEL